MDHDVKSLAELSKPNLRPWKLLFGLLVLMGAATFLAGISGVQAQRAWQAYLVNFVFWSAYTP